MNKKSAEAVSSLIIFIVVISITLSVALFFQNYMVETEDSLDKKKTITNGKIKTDLTFVSIDYENQELSIYIKNTGDMDIEMGYLDAILNGEYVQNLEVFNAKDLNVQIDFLQIQEVALIKIPITLSSQTHTLKLISEYGNIFEEKFNT